MAGFPSGGSCNSVTQSVSALPTYLVCQSLGFPLVPYGFMMVGPKFRVARNVDSPLSPFPFPSPSPSGPNFRLARNVDYANYARKKLLHIFFTSEGGEKVKNMFSSLRKKIKTRGRGILLA